jgi:hypothetical protein
MKQKHLVTLGIVIILLVSLFSTAAAQTGTTPEASPTAVTSGTPTTAPTPEPGAKFFTHPIVKLLGAYFDLIDSINNPTPTPDPLVTPTVAPTDTSGLGPIGKQIAAYHEEGMGFGVLVKLYAMAQASAEACQTTTASGGTCTAVTADELVTSFNSGTGMGALFKEYGKPALRGVGQVRKALKNLDLQATPVPQVDSSKGKGSGKGNGKGHNK